MSSDEKHVKQYKNTLPAGSKNLGFEKLKNKYMHSDHTHNYFIGDLDISQMCRKIISEGYPFFQMCMHFFWFYVWKCENVHFLTVSFHNLWKKSELEKLQYIFALI